MSRIGKKLIAIPEGVTVTVKDLLLSAKGPKGTLTRTLHRGTVVTVADNQVTVTTSRTSPEASALWGLERALISNMLVGVSTGFTEKLEINGVGFKFIVQGKKLTLEVGYSHPVEMAIPDGLEVKAEKNTLTISGMSKDVVGQFAANVRAIKPPEPYKGKGIKYADEHIRRKEGKKAAAAE